MVWIIENIKTAIDLFSTVAQTDPLSAILVIIGGLLMAFSLVVFGILTLGGILDLFTPDNMRPPANHEQS